MSVSILNYSVLDEKKQRKLTATLLILSMALVIGSMDIYLPALPKLRTFFGKSDFFLQLTLLVSPLLSAVLAVFFGRICDVYGRRLIFLASFSVFVLGTLICTLSFDYETFLTGRICQSIGGGGISTITVVILSDLFKGVQYARYMALYGALFPIIWAICPIIGAELFERFGWRSNFLFILLNAFFLVGFLYKKLPETKPQTSQQLESFKESFKTLLKNVYFMFMCFGHGFPVAIFVVFICYSPFIYNDHFNVSTREFALFQAFPMVINLSSAFVYRFCISKIGLDKCLQIGMVGYAVSTFWMLIASLNFLPLTPYIICFLISCQTASMPFVISTCATKAFGVIEPDKKGIAVSLVSITRNVSSVLLVGIVKLFYTGNLNHFFLICSVFIVGLISILMMSSAYKK